MIVYAIEHCPCIFESEFETISLHTSLIGAAKAMNSYKNNRHESFTITVASDYSDEELFEGLLFKSARINMIGDTHEAFRYRKIEIGEWHD